MKLVKWQSRIGLVVFVAGAALFGGSGLVIAQSPEPSGTASESPEARTLTPSTSEATSGVSQFSLVTCCKATRPRCTFSKIASAVAVQTKGFGARLFTWR